MGIEALRLRP